MTSFARAIVSPVAASPSLTVSASPDQLPVLRSLVRTVAAHYALSLGGLWTFSATLSTNVVQSLRITIIRLSELLPG